MSSAEDLAMRGPLVAALAAGFDGDPSRVAVIDETGTFSWRAIVRAASDTARSLGERGGRVGVLDISDSELLCVMLAAAMVGRPVCTLHGDWSDAELRAALQDADVEEVFTRRASLPTGAAVSDHRSSASGPRTSGAASSSRAATRIPCSTSDSRRGRAAGRSRSLGASGRGGR